MYSCGGRETLICFLYIDVAMESFVMSSSFRIFMPLKSGAVCSRYELFVIIRIIFFMNKVYAI